MLDPLVAKLAAEERPYLNWKEAVDRQPELGYLLPGKVKFLREMMASKSIKTAWDAEFWYPQEVAK